MTTSTHLCTNCARLGRGKVRATHRAPQSGIVRFFYLCRSCAAGYDRMAFMPAEVLL